MWLHPWDEFNTGLLMGPLGSRDRKDRPISGQSEARAQSALVAERALIRKAFLGKVLSRPIVCPGLTCQNFFQAD